MVTKRMFAILRVVRINAPLARKVFPAVVELAGLSAIVVGVGAVFAPAAAVVGGLGLIIWAQGLGD